MAADWGKLHLVCSYACETWRVCATSFSYYPFISCLFWFGSSCSFFLCCGNYIFQLTAIFVLVLLVVSVCACLLTGVAQFELLVNSLSNLASRVLTAWQWDEAWLLLLPGTTCSVEDKGRTGGSKKMATGADVPTFIPCVSCWGTYLQPLESFEP